MGQRNHTTATVRVKAQHHIIWHFFGERDAIDGPCTAVFIPGVTDRDSKAIEQGHGGQVLGQLPSPNQQHSVFGAKGVG